MSGEALLPPEIWSQILTKLPVKSILRCRYVCKTWYSLISCPTFVSYHTAQTLNQNTSNRVLIHRWDPKTQRYIVISHDESFVESYEHNDILKPFLSSSVEIVGSCNGLVCLHKREPGCNFNTVDTFLVWNPSIGKVVHLPIRSSPPNTYDILGFGFDSGSSDYKVLRMVYPRTENAVVSEILDLRKGVWRSLSPPTRPLYYKYDCLCVYLHGNLHWIVNDYFPGCTLLSFNLSGEVFREMEMPGVEEPEQCRDVDGFHKIVLINRLLSVAVMRRRRELRRDVCTVWSMKEYGVTESWTKLFYFDLPYCWPYTLRRLDLMRFWENGEVLIMDRVKYGILIKGLDDANVSGNALILHNAVSGVSKALHITEGNVYNVCFYTESLVLL